MEVRWFCLAKSLSRDLRPSSPAEGKFNVLASCKIFEDGFPPFLLLELHWGNTSKWIIQGLPIQACENVKICCLGFGRLGSGGLDSFDSE